MWSYYINDENSGEDGKKIQKLKESGREFRIKEEPKEYLDGQFNYIILHNFYSKFDSKTLYIFKFRLKKS